MEHLHPSCPWSQFEPGSIQFCEQRLCGWIVEPANTWSNIGYIIAGIYVLQACRQWSRKNGPTSLTLIGISSVLVGIGSTLFHGTGTRWGEILDVSAMYLISGLFITFGLNNLMNLSRLKLFSIYASITGASSLYLILSKSNGIRLFALQLAVMALLEFRIFKTRTPRPNYRYLIIMVLSFGASYGAWLLDFHRIICNPDNHILGGHAVWHLTNATCMWSYFKYQQQFDARA